MKFAAQMFAAVAVAFLLACPLRADDTPTPETAKKAVATSDKDGTTNSHAAPTAGEAAHTDEERHRHIVFDARDIETLNGALCNEVAHHSINARRRQLPMPKSFDDDVHAVREATPCLLSVRWRSNRIVSPRQ